MSYLKSENYSIDTSTTLAFQDIVESEVWANKFSIYSAKRDVIMAATVDEIFDWALENIVDVKFKIFFGRCAYLWNECLSMRFDGDFDAKETTRNRNEYDIIFSGERHIVKSFVRKFDEDFEDRFVPDHQNVEWVSMGAHGLEYTSMPIKNDRKFYSSMYPYINGGDIDGYIDNFLNSTANVLILKGDPGLGKSALINKMILDSEVKAYVVYDPQVMRTDALYSRFVTQTFRDGGGLMVMEDADVMLSSREVSQNETMSKILNLADGIIDTSSAKFVFSANIKNVHDIDEALTRPGRCFDIVDFRTLTREEAEAAAKDIGKELQGDKKEYTIAEIFNSRVNETARKSFHKIGFV